MFLDHVLIGLLAGGERHGYDLRRQYLARFPSAKPVAAAQVYATLDRLVRDGWVEPAAREQAGGPERLTYALTAAGRSELRRWLTEVEEPAPFIANPLSVKVTIALIAADEETAQGFLARQRAAHLSRMRVLTQMKLDRNSSPEQLLAADYALDHLDADLRWIDTAVDRVSALAKEINA
jgi:DNA-binding PadR family transcriptional regulator